MVLRRALCCSVLGIVLSSPAAAEPPRGSISIERIADIECPTNRPWSRPLSMLQATNDKNVPFRDSLRLIDVLLKMHTSFEMGIYPGEIRFFRRAHVLRDARHRAEDFFDRYLKQEGAATHDQ